MALRLMAPRYLLIVQALLVFSLMTAARAQDAAPQPQLSPAAAPSGQKAGAATGTRSNAANPPAAEPHRLPLRRQQQPPDCLLREGERAAHADLVADIGRLAYLVMHAHHRCPPHP